MSSTASAAHPHSPRSFYWSPMGQDVSEVVVQTRCATTKCIFLKIHLENKDKIGMRAELAVICDGVWRREVAQ